MEKQDLIKEIKPTSKIWKFFRRYIINKYTIVFVFFFIWIVFLDSNSILVVNELDKEIDKYENQLEYYKTEYEKNNAYYKKLMNNKDEKEKFARENYFMKRKNEEIFILVADSAEVK